MGDLCSLVFSSVMVSTGMTWVQFGIGDRPILGESPQPGVKSRLRCAACLHGRPAVCAVSDSRGMPGAEDAMRRLLSFGAPRVPVLAPTRADGFLVFAFASRGSGGLVRVSRLVAPGFALRFIRCHRQRPFTEDNVFSPFATLLGPVVLMSLFCILFAWRSQASCVGALLMRFLCFAAVRLLSDSVAVASGRLYSKKL